MFTCDSYWSKKNTTDTLTFQFCLDVEIHCTRTFKQRGRVNPLSKLNMCLKIRNTSENVRKISVRAEEKGGGGGAVAQSVERTTPAE